MDLYKHLLPFPATSGAFRPVAAEFALYASPVRYSLLW